MKKCAVIYNPESGKPIKKKELDKLSEILNKNNYKAIVCPTKGPKDAINLVESLEDDIDLVICVGGDGTLNEGITGNLKRKKKLLISQLPIGTTNDVGTMYGYSKDITVNTYMLLNGTKKNIDVCLLNNHPFIYVSCIGSYVDSSYDTPRDIKKKYGHIAYLINTLKKFNKEKIKTFNLTYEVEGKTVSGEYSFIFITNTNRMGGFNNLYSDVKLDDGMFEVALAKVKTKAELLALGSKILTGSIDKIKDIEYYKTNYFKVIFDEVPPSWVFDGEEYKHNEKEFIFTINKEINMLVPKKNMVKLFNDLEEFKK